MEEWKVFDISQFRFNTTTWEISNLGNVRKTSSRKGTTKPVKTYLGGGYEGHRYLCLPKNNNKYVHRLVALHFVPNPNPLKCNVVDHIDKDSTNNHWTNLRWVTFTTNNTNTTKQCIHCGKIGNSNSFGQHVKWCKQNPNRNTPQWKD